MADATVTATAVSLAEQIAARLRSFDFDGLADLYRPDALIDVSVPQWRFQLRGRDAVRELFRTDLALVRDSGRVSGWRETPTADGLVVEWEVRFVAEGEERLFREVHVFRTDGVAITEHADYCTGIWDAATIARQAVEAPMVQP